MPEGAGVPGAHFALPLPPQQEDSRDERGMPGPPGPMQVSLQPSARGKPQEEVAFVS